MLVIFLGPDPSEHKHTSIYENIYRPLWVVICRKFLQTVCANVCGFTYVLQLLRTFVNGFCVNIWLLCIFVYGFFASCAAFADVYGCVCVLSGFWFFESLDDPILRVLRFFIVCANARDLLKVSMIRSKWFCWVLFPHDMFVIIGPSRGSDLKGSVKFFFRASYLLLLGRLGDQIFRVPSSYFPDNLIAIQSLILPRRFLVDLDRVIYLSWSNNITVHYATMW